MQVARQGSHATQAGIWGLDSTLPQMCKLGEVPGRRNGPWHAPQAVEPMQAFELRQGCWWVAHLGDDVLKGALNVDNVELPQRIQHLHSPPA